MPDRYVESSAEDIKLFSPSPVWVLMLGKSRILIAGPILNFLFADDYTGAALLFLLCMPKSAVNWLLVV